MLTRNNYKIKKYSILKLYHHIFSVSSNRFKWVCVIVAIFVTAYSIMLLCIVLLACIPIESNWDAAVTGHCIDFGSALSAASSLNVVSDALVLVLPIPLIWRIKTSIVRRCQIMGIFLLGSFIIVVSIIRTIYIGQSSFSAGLDDLWGNSYPVIWSTIEPGLAIVAACLPVLRPVLNKVLHGSIDSAQGMGTPAAAAVSQGGASGREPHSQERKSGGRVAHLITIGGSKLPIAAGAPAPGGRTDSTSTGLSTVDCPLPKYAV